MTYEEKKKKVKDSITQTQIPGMFDELFETVDNSLDEILGEEI